MNSNLYCVIMAGGVGTRFWPLSKTDKPKQFIDILGTGKSIIRQTYERFSGKIKRENFIVITNIKYRDIVLEHIPELSPSQVLCEPMRRNTAPCISYAAHHIAAIDPNAIMIVTPSDHIVTNQYEFDKAIDITSSFAAGGDRLVTIGINPSRPETGYGYIQLGEKINDTIHEVKLFTEKPDKEMAEIFINSGEFYWNSGIFVWSCDSILKALSNNIPENEALFNQDLSLYGTDKEEELIDKIYPQCSNISIDYGVMEHADNVFVYCSDPGWSDIGTWNSLYENRDHDTNGNLINGDNIITYDSDNCIIELPKNKVAVIGDLTNYLVVDSGDVLLICLRDNEQKIKEYVEIVEARCGSKFV